MNENTFITGKAKGSLNGILSSLFLSKPVIVDKCCKGLHSYLALCVHAGKELWDNVSLPYIQSQASSFPLLMEMLAAEKGRTMTSLTSPSRVGAKQSSCDFSRKWTLKWTPVPSC